MPGFDLKQMNRNDRGVLGGGLVALFFSFFPHYYGASVNFLGKHISVGVSAWHSYAFLGMLLILAATGVAAARVSGTKIPTLPVGVNLLITALAGLGTLLVILRGFTAGSGAGVGYSYGVQWSGYIVMLAGIVQTVFSVLNFRASGEKLAWDSSVLSNAGQAQGTAAPYAAAQGAAAPPVAPQPAAPSDPTSQQTPGI